MKRLTEYTCETHIYMKLQLDNGSIEEIDVYLRNGGTTYKTTADYDLEKRNEVIDAFNELY